MAYFKFLLVTRDAPSFIIVNGCVECISVPLSENSGRRHFQAVARFLHIGKFHAYFGYENYYRRIRRTPLCNIRLDEYKPTHYLLEVSLRRLFAYVFVVVLLQLLETNVSMCA